MKDNDSMANTLNYPSDDDLKGINDEMNIMLDSAVPQLTLICRNRLQHHAGDHNETVSWRRQSYRYLSNGNTARFNIVIDINIDLATQ